MKRATKIWLIAAAFLIIVGGAVFCAAMSWVHWDFAAVAGPYYEARETRTLVVNEEFRNIALHCGTEDVSFLPSEDGTCRVAFYEEEEKQRHGVEVDVDDATLLITLADTREWYERITFFYAHTPRVTVYLPKTAYGSLVAEAGKTTLPKELSFEEIVVSADTGDVDCRASASGLIRIKTSTGDIRCENISASALELSASTGRIDARSVTCADDVQVSVSTGEVFLRDVSCRNVLSRGSTGELLLDHVVVAETITVERSTGDVNLKQCDAAELLITTSTGDVTGSLLSPKVFVAHSDTGQIDVPETTTGGKCKIVTDTGNIAITVP